MKLIPLIGMLPKPSNFSLQLIVSILVILVPVTISILSSSSLKGAVNVELDVTMLRLNALLSHVMLLMLSFGLFYLPFHKMKFISFSLFDKWPSWTAVLIGILIIGFSIPLVAFLMKLNEAIQIGEFLKQEEGIRKQMLEVITDMKTPVDLVITLFLLAVVPAFSEEIMFRGIFQRLLHNVMNVHFAVIIAGFVFSAIHLQFEGFLPRWFLGIVLGYLFYYSQSIWLPILIHAIFNGHQIVVKYFFPDMYAQMEDASKEDIPFYLAAFASVVVASGLYFIAKSHKKTENE